MENSIIVSVMHFRTTVVRTLLTLLVMQFFITSTAMSKDLTLYIWEGYIADKVLEQFKDKTGVSVNQVFFDSDQVRDEVMVTTQGEKFDIVLFHNVAAQIFGKNNLLNAISKNTIPNSVNIDERWQESCGNFGLPYFYGTTGIVYDKTRFPIPPDSWLDLLKPKDIHKGHVGMVEDGVDTMIPPLVYLGYNINTEDKNELKEAYNLLLEQEPDVLSYKYALTILQSKEPKEELHMAFGYGGDQAVLNEETGTENWDYVIPREGTVVWIDCMTVSSRSKNIDIAYQFLDFLADPKIAAINSEEVYNATPISAAKKFMSKDVVADKALFPPEEKVNKAQFYRIISDDTVNLRKRILVSLLKKHEAQ